MVSASLSPNMEAALTQYKSKGHFEGVHKNTMKALERRGLVERSNAIVPVSETIGSAQRYRWEWYDQTRYDSSPTKDARRGDYAFWDRLRKGLSTGYEIAGVFLKPLESKVSGWTIGNKPKLKSENPDTQTHIADWWNENHSQILQAFRESIGLGDCYLVFNGDGSLTVVPPHVVTPIVDEKDYSKVIGYRITERYNNPMNANVMTIEDRYYADRRERVTFQYSVGENKQRFKNPLGRIQVLHIPNNAGADELFGRPEGEALLKILEWYNEIMVAGLQGNIRQGRPTPVMEGMTPEQIDHLWDTFGTDVKYYDENNEEQIEKIIRFNSDTLLTTSGAFKYAQPGAFAGETEKLAGLLFYLILQHTEVPEFIWGNAIASSKASAESQLPAFATFIEGKQASILWWVKALVQMAVTWYSTFEPTISENDVVDVTFPPLTGQDGKLTLDAINLGLSKGLLDKETALHLMPLDIDDPQAVLKAVEKEEQAAQDAFDRRMTQQAEEDTGFDDSPQDEQEMESISEATNLDAASAYVPLPNSRGVLYTVRMLKEMINPDDVIEWQAAPTYHVTLCHAQSLPDSGIDSMRKALKLQEPIHIVGETLNVFETPDGYALHIELDHTPVLDAVQSEIYAQFSKHGSGISEFSNPEQYKPHITLAYLKKNRGWQNAATSINTFAEEVIIGRDDYEPSLIVRASDRIESDLFTDALERIIGEPAAD